MKMDYQRQDAMLMEILSERKTITGFLEAVFGFLHRNTDFYHNKTHPDDKIGFFPFDRERVIFDVFQRYNTLGEIKPALPADECVPDAVSEVCVTTTEQKNEVIFDVAKKKESRSDKYTEFFPSDYKNGAKHDNYSWSQSLKDIEIHIQLPPEVKCAKDLKINAELNSITVNKKGDKAAALLKGDFIKAIKHNDIIWTVDNGRLVICFDKMKEQWWDRLFTHDTEIDIKALDSERFIDELPETTQAKIQKLHLEQTESVGKEGIIEVCENKDSENFNIYKRLQKAWDLEGSPFKGTPFDATKVQIN